MGLRRNDATLLAHVADGTDPHEAAGYTRGVVGRRKFEQATPPQIDPGSTDPAVAHGGDRWLRTRPT
ncbi:MAG: hypothetical protein AB7G37_03475 [Solirubrobacteraceae bacterium]